MVRHLHVLSYQTQQSRHRSCSWDPLRVPDGSHKHRGRRHEEKSLGEMVERHLHELIYQFILFHAILSLLYASFEHQSFKFTPSSPSLAKTCFYAVLRLPHTLKYAVTSQRSRFHSQLAFRYQIVLSPHYHELPTRIVSTCIRRAPNFRSILALTCQVILFHAILSLHAHTITVRGSKCPLPRFPHTSGHPLAEEPREVADEKETQFSKEEARSKYPLRSPGMRLLSRASTPPEKD